VPTGIDGIRATDLVVLRACGACMDACFQVHWRLRCWLVRTRHYRPRRQGSRNLNVELNNCRAAMMGVMGNMVAEVLTGHTMYEQYASGHIAPFGDGQGVF